MTQIVFEIFNTMYVVIQAVFYLHLVVLLVLCLTLEMEYPTLFPSMKVTPFLKLSSTVPLVTVNDDKLKKSNLDI